VGAESCEAREEGRRAGGRQTRASGWKGGRDFVSSSFFLVVEICALWMVKLLFLAKENNSGIA
jgi:hypothetical protein